MRSPQALVRGARSPEEVVALRTQGFVEIVERHLDNLSGGGHLMSGTPCLSGVMEHPLRRTHSLGTHSLGLFYELVHL